MRRNWVNRKANPDLSRCAVMEGLSYVGSSLRDCQFRAALSSQLRTGTDTGNPTV